SDGQYQMMSAALAAILRWTEATLIEPRGFLLQKEFLSLSQNKNSGTSFLPCSRYFCFFG
ncbi:hypothetical protein, partial [Sporomusa malonica]|uniref:hypothetical protein n=1 Tax=Sporomusa malonica TaxID=112901 RepID=UPI001C3904DE